MLLYLIGYMYSGKTTVGRQLAQALGCPFYDTDQLFEEHFHTTIPLCFQRYGENAFHQLEREVLHSTGNLGPAVIATGGGTPCYFDNMVWINSHGTAIYCDVTLSTLLLRAERSRKTRPVLAGMASEERRLFMEQQLAARLPYYRQAPIHFPADNPDLAALLKLVR